MLHQLRWRHPLRERGRSWAGWVLALLLHLLFVAGTWWEMQPRPGEETVTTHRTEALQVRLIPRAETASAPPPPAPLAPPAPPPPPRPRPVREAPSPNAMTVSLPASAATVAPQPLLFDANGQPLLPGSAAAGNAPGYVQNGPQGDAGVMQHKTTITYKETRFEKHWEKSDNLFDSALRKAVEKTSVTHTFHVAPGVRIKCGISFAALAGGCGAADPPSRASAKVGDERLSMAPTAALAAPGEPPPEPPGVDECIAIYRANQPLPHGCPVDTPNRSVDAELQEKAAVGR
ncbi:hypothetical protein EYV96_14495 [Dyella terrae]|uniref:Uncharacterized protein n=3 Tax=Rhodanobacteraceae TaxID=1775411 RepID=A0A4R0YMG3_9GAMM|nr:hypothetical protein EYV96_14495 [Dyella terrae]TCI08688.1 hypothetical protein EZM97_24375 [Dyella soli]